MAENENTNDLPLLGASTHIVVDGSYVIAEGADYKGFNCPADNGGVFYVSTSGSLRNNGAASIHGNQGKNGGGIYNDGTVSLNGVELYYNQSNQGDGGAIYNNGICTVVNCSIYENSVVIYGQASAIYNNGTFIATKTTISNNVSQTSGAIVNRKTMSFTSCAFSGNNFLLNSGGAIQNEKGTLTLTDCTFSNNQSRNGGAAIYATGGCVNLCNVDFNDNLSLGYSSVGTAIYVSDATINILGKVQLLTSNDTVYFASGTLNWDLASAGSDTDFNFAISKWSQVDGDFSTYVTVKGEGDQTAGTYTLAENVTADSFSVTLRSTYSADKVLSVTTASPTAAWYGTNYQKFTLGLQDGQATITADEAAFQRTIVSITVLNYPYLPSEPEASLPIIHKARRSVTNMGVSIVNMDNSTLDGGAYYVDATGDLIVADMTFKGNQGRLGGAIYTTADRTDKGTVTLSNVTFTGNTSSGEYQSGAIYNESITIFTGNVTLSTDTDIIYNKGALVWSLTNTGCGYVSHLNRIHNEKNGLLTLSIGEDLAYGTYKVAGNVGSETSDLEFILEDASGWYETITVNGPTVVYSKDYAGTLYVGADNALYLQLTAVRQVVNKANFPPDGVLTLKDGMSVDMSRITTYEGNGALYCVEADGTLNNNGSLEITGCSATGKGGVIYNEGVVDLQNCTFSNNRTTGNNGGVIYNYGGTVTITGATFANNLADGYLSGGAIANENKGVMTLRNVFFNNNSTQGFGGAIIVKSDATLILDNVTFNGNSTVRNGGAIYGEISHIRLEGAVTLSTATDTLYLCSCANLAWVVNGSKTGYVSDYSLVTGIKNAHTLTVDATKANANATYVLADNARSANSQKFTLMLKDGTSQIITVNGDALTDSDQVNYRLITNVDNQLMLSLTSRTVVSDLYTVEDNGLIDLTGCTAYDGDGGAFLVTSTGTLKSNEDSNASVMNCSATGNGGAIMNEGSLDMDTVYLANNTAEGNGGAICTSGTLSLTNSTFTANSAEGLGGALFIASGTSTLSGTFSENQAVQGGALYVASGATLNLGETAFYDNVATLDGMSKSGAVYNCGTVNLTDKVELGYSTDTFYNEGILNWNLAAGVTVSGFQYIENAGSLTITVSADMPMEATYTIASGDFTGSYANIFTLKGVDDAVARIRVNGAKTVYNDRCYSLTTDGEIMTLTSTSLIRNHEVKSDLNGNGTSDVVFQWTNGDNQVGYWMDGTNDWRSESRPLAATTRVVGAYDMDADGRADTVLYDSECGILGYAPSGYTADFVTSGTLGNSANQVVKLGNLTGEKDKNSYVIQDTTSGQLTVWRNGDQSQALALEGCFVGTDWTFAGTGDFTGSGVDCAVLMDAWGIVKTVGLNDEAPKTLCTIGPNWDLRAIGDFSDDGIDDLVFFSTDTGSMFMMENGTNYKNIGQLDAKDWFVIGAGDYNGDQKDDLLVRQYSTGMLGYYADGDYSKWNELGRGVDMNWTVTIA